MVGDGVLLECLAFQDHRIELGNVSLVVLLLIELVLDDLVLLGDEPVLQCASLGLLLDRLNELRELVIELFGVLSRTCELLVERGTFEGGLLERML